MTCTLINVMHAYVDRFGLKTEDVEWEDFMVELTDKLYEIASSFSD